MSIVGTNQVRKAEQNSEAQEEMSNQRNARRSNLVLAAVVATFFVLLEIIGPVFVAQPEFLAQHMTIALLAFGAFFMLAAIQLGTSARLRGWVVVLVFLAGYLVLLFVGDGEFQPDWHWFVSSPLGYITGALVLGNLGAPRDRKMADD